jgi:hypothetical protein
MKRVLTSGAYIWTACGAGWIVIGGVTGIDIAIGVGIGCVAMAGAFLIMSDAW